MPATFSDGTTTTEQFSSNFKILAQKGYLEIAGVPSKKKATDKRQTINQTKKLMKKNLKKSLKMKILSTKRQN